MEKFIIIEIGSTNTKAYLYENDKVNDLGFKTIEFKNNFKKNNEILNDDKNLLYDYIKSFSEKNIYVYGTSIFRNLTEEQKESWKIEFKQNTGLDFNIVSSDEENELTVYGAISNINIAGKIAVMIGGGGSTELSIVENNKIIEKCNFPFGAIDVVEMFPDLKEDYATSNFEEMLCKINTLIKRPKNKVDKMILAGGDYIYFYEELNYPVEKNNFYTNELQPYALSIDIMNKYDYKFIYEMSLDEICKRTNKEGWWRGARGARLCVKALVDILGVKYIIPTRISMVYGIVEKIKNNEGE